MLNLTLEERFWRHVDRSDGCWLWKGTLHRMGYGRLRFQYQELRAHRVSYELHHGLIPDGLCVCHHCDNRLCVNPEHLFLGTHGDNAADRSAKGRSAKSMAKLTIDQVMSIRERYAKGDTSHRKLAREYGVQHAEIGRIVRGIVWR